MLRYERSTLKCQKVHRCVLAALYTASIIDTHYTIEEGFREKAAIIFIWYHAYFFFFVDKKNYNNPITLSLRLANANELSGTSIVSA